MTAEASFFTSARSCTTSHSTVCEFMPVGAKRAISNTASSTGFSTASCRYRRIDRRPLINCSTTAGVLRQSPNSGVQSSASIPLCVSDISGHTATQCPQSMQYWSASSGVCGTPASTLNQPSRAGRGAIAAESANGFVDGKQIFHGFLDDFLINGVFIPSASSMESQVFRRFLDDSLKNGICSKGY